MRKIKRIRRKIRRLIVKGFIGFDFLVFVMSICALDSDYWKSAVAVFLMSFAILVMFAIANGAMGGDWDER
jgi:hypothetical protein